ncbi:hypothetical protein L3X38_025317 [Prunus dulcis]|uniref:Uncharacterized protein n=1 Tax=Prunus dulcis TaxID=3755 RepID=A0AAD4Z7B5_PRUDU|nr:hypothetical protein L3X38_025317 [Prunus dulcis]
MLDCLKKRLEGVEGKWVDELPGVLGAYRTTKRRSTGETPFSLAYGTEAIIPSHITVPSMSIEVGSLDQNCKQMRVNLDLLEEEREKAIVRVATYKQQLTSHYNKKAKIRQFQPGNLVLRKSFITALRQGSKKMKPNWEGPYVISRSGGSGSYTLDTLEGKEIPDNGMPTTFGDTIHEAFRLPARLLASDEPPVLPLKTNCFRCYLCY